MKTLLLNSKILITTILIFVVSFNLKAQCTANYSFSVNPANNGQITFSNTSTSGSGYFYYWSFGDGASSTSANPGTYTYASSGAYNVCLTIYDSLGMFDSILGCYNTYCDTVSVINGSGSSTCNASFIPYDSAGYVYFYNTSIGSGITSTWDFDDGTTGTSTGDIAHLYSSPGAYVVCLTISNFLGTCVQTYCDSVIVGNGTSGSCMGVVNPYFTSADSAGYTNFYNTPTGSSPVYFWDFGDGTSSFDVGNTTHIYSSNGTYMVCLTVYETAGGMDSCQYCNYVTVGTTPSCNASFFIVQDSTNLYNYNLYNTSSSSGSTSYFWDFGDGTSSTLQYPSHTYASTSPVQICLTISDGVICTATYCDSIDPGHMPSSVFTINVLPLGIQEQVNTISLLENYPNPFAENTTINYSILKGGQVELSIFDLLGNKAAVVESSNKSAGKYSINFNSENLSEGMYLLQLKINNDALTKKIIIRK